MKNKVKGDTPKQAGRYSKTAMKKNSHEDTQKTAKKIFKNSQEIPKNSHEENDRNHEINAQLVNEE